MIDSLVLPVTTALTAFLFIGVIIGLNSLEP